VVSLFVGFNKALYLKATVTYVRKVFSRSLLGTILVETGLEGVLESQVSCQVVVVVSVFVGYFCKQQQKTLPQSDHHFCSQSFLKTFARDKTGWNKLGRCV